MSPPVPKDFAASGTNTQNLPDFWIFFVYCLVVVTVVVFFLFYFNRALANILSKIINFYAWNKYHAHIDIESIQFALLGGRILFKNVRYYSTNQSIFILKGHITMRYWLWGVRKEGEGLDTKNPRRPCRILCNFQGVEWFMYNRTPAYYMLQEMLGTAKAAAGRPESGVGEGFEGVDSSAPLVEERTVTLDDLEQLANVGPENSLFRRLMPIQLDITTGAITIGNSDLESIMVVEFTQANGIYNTSQAPSPHDLYRTSLNLALREPKCNLRYNPDYTRPTVGRPLREPVPSETTHWYNPFSYLKAYLHRRDRARARRVNIARAQTWRGLERYRDELADEADQTAQNEYARVSQLLECSELTLTYYADVPGKVPRNQQLVDGIDIGNGGPAPEWGVHITARDGMLHYGPWADRQRGSMMKFFFPASHRNMKKTPYLRAGQTRMPTAIKIYIEFLSQTTVRVPLREASKNWKHARHSTNDDATELDDPMRPYGWINLMASKDSWLKFVVPTVADDNGYANTLLVELAGLNVVSSTNYASLLSAKRLKIEANMHNPLIWNSPRTWTFDFKFTKPQIYLLRDHLFLIQDLVKDWTAGSSTDLTHFVPTAYVLRITLDDFILNLCVNEHNIINNPTDKDDNAFIIIKGQRLKSVVTLPFLKFEPESNKISFDVDIENAKLEITLPATHTLGAFLTEESSHCGSVVSFSLNGTYEFFSFLDPSHLESLTMFLKGSGVTFKLFGFTVRYLLILRENYFGPFMNFSTLEEYRRRREHPEEARDMARRQAEAKAPSDPFEVFISLILEDGSLILPENLYDRANSSLIEFHELQLELRILDVYLDLYLNTSPLTWTREGSAMVRKEKFKMKNTKDNQNYLYIDELNLYAHRLVGPRPRSATYVARWQFDIGTITGQLKPSFLLGIVSFGKTFLYNMVDEDNALPSEFLTKPEPEVTFLQASVKEIDIALWGRQSATQVILKEGLKLEYDNLISEKYNSKVTLVLPQLTVKSLANTEQISTARDYYNSDPMEHPWVEVAHLDSSINATIYRSTANWQDARRAQQNYIRMQDKDTRRCPFLYETDEAAMESRSQRSYKSHKSAYEHYYGMSYAPPLASKFADRQMSAIPHERVIPQFLDSMDDHEDKEDEEDEEELYGPGGSVAASSTHLVSDRKVSIIVDDTSLTRRSSKSSKESKRSSTSTGTESFKTASDGEGSEHGSVNSDNDDNDGNVSIYSNDEDEEPYVILELEEDQRSDSNSSISDDELSDLDGEPLSPTSSETPIPAAIPPSIPYRSYLKRYRVHRSRPVNNNHAFFNAFLPPPRTFFSPAMANDTETHQQPEQDDEHLNSAFSKTVNSSFASLEQMNTDEPPAADKDSANGNDLTVTIVLESAKAVNILLTPIFVKIVQEVTEAINSEDWDLETMLDTTQMDYIGQLTRYLTAKYTSTRFAVSVPKLHCHFIQDVMLPDDLTKANEDQTMIRTRYDLSDTVLCSADVILDRVVLFGSVKFQDMAFDQNGHTVAESSLKLLESRAHLDFNGLSCKVRFVSSSSLVGIFGIPVERQHHNAYAHSGNLATEPVVIDVTVDQFNCKWLGATRPNSLQLDVSKISAIIINESVEILVGGVTSWLTFVGDLKMILNDFSERRSHQLQAFIAAIAKFAMEDNTGTDPVFLTRPLNMLRLGPLKFRNDVGWKLLAHMRHLLRFMPLPKAQTLQYRLTSGDAIKNIDSKKLFKFVIDTFSQWRSWEIGDISEARLFTQPFNQNDRKPADSGKGMVDQLIDFLVASMNLGHIRIGGIDFSIYGGAGDNNSIALAKIEVDVQSQFRDDVIVSSEHRKSTDSDKLRQRILGYLDLTCCLKLGLIDITADPNLLAFTKHMLKVQRVFSAKLAALDNANRKVKDSITISVTQPVTESNTQAREAQRMSDLAGSAPAKDETIAATLDLKELISRLDVLAQALVMVERVNVSANAEGLSMKSEVAGIQVSALYSNPQLTSLPLEKAEADSVSGIRSSHKGSKKSDKISNRLIISAMSGVRSIKTSIEEMTYTGGVASYNLLLSFDLTGINTSAALSSMSRHRHKRPEPDREVFNIFLGIHGISIKLPQSLLKLYNFVEGWSAENKKSYDFLFKNLMDEWEEQRRSSSIPNADGPALILARTPASTANREIKIQCLLKNLAFQSDLLPSLNLQYEIWDLFFMVQQSSANLLGPGLSYACQLTKQEVRFITKNKAERMPLEASEGQTGSFAIPVIRASGNIRALGAENKHIPVGSRRGSIVSASASAPANTTISKLNSYLSMDFVSLTLNVNMIDHLLTAQSLVGNEITEVFDLFSFAKRRKENHIPQTTSTLVPSPLVNLLYSFEISLRGLRVTVLSPVAIGFFESNILSGLITNAPIARNHRHLNPDKLAWKFSAHNFSLSLNHNAGDLQDQSYEDANMRRYRLAYIVIDFAIQNYRASALDVSKGHNQEEVQHSGEEVDSFFLDFPKIHAVMQPIALGKLTDLYIYYDTELKKRSQKKADEIDRLAANTRRILQSLDVEVPKVTERSRSLWEEKLLSLQISRFAAAIPLDSRDDVISLTTEGPNEVGALLVSVASINFVTRKLETSYARLGEISAQFVTRFDQSKEEHFAPQNHPKMNRISLPSISCEVYAGATEPKQPIWIDAKVDGFEVDVDGTLVNHLNTLNDIYRASLERVNAFTAETNFGSRSDESRAKTEIQNLSEHKEESPKVSFLDIEGSFVYRAGVCRLYPKSHALRQSSKRVGSPTVTPLITGRSSFGASVESRRIDSGPAEIQIPGLNAWVTYQTPIGNNAASSTTPKRAHAEVMIHPSENKLNPSLVPFLQEVVAGLKIGIQQSSEQKAVASANTAMNPIIGMNLSLYLRLSKSRLELSCQPISKVVCELNWEEGNFLMAVGPTDDSIQTMTCVGQIRGASGNVRHMFSPEACLRAELKDIGFNAMLMTRRTETVKDDSISIAIDIPHISAELNIRHLQDLFILQSVWLDQSIIDIMSGAYEPPKTLSTLSPATGTPVANGSKPNVDGGAGAKPNPFAKYFVVRLQRLNLSSDLGQAIGKVVFTTKNIMVDTRDIPGRTRSIRVSTDAIDLRSDGRLEGTASMAGWFLDGKFTRPSIDYVPNQDLSLAKLTFQTSQILASLEYEFQKILVASIDPIKLTCSDVWSEPGLGTPSALIDVHMSLDTIIVLGSIKTIPVFITMSNKLLALIEEKRAKAGNDVKNRMQKGESSPIVTSSQTVITPVEIAIKDWLIRPQARIVLNLNNAKVTVFPNHFYDADCVQLNAREMNIDLIRDMINPVREHRVLKAHFKSAALLKSVTKKMNRADEKIMTIDQWFDHASSSSSRNILGIPKTTLTMETWQTVGTNEIDHSFQTVFDGRVDIALNFGLIKYLQDLANLYAEQIKRGTSASASNEMALSPTTNPPVLPPWDPRADPVDSVAAGASETIISLPPAIDPSSSTTSTGSRELMFHPIEPVGLDPQLRIMGDATPPLEWVGVQRQKIPALIHTELTLNLEKVLLVLQQVYRSQVSDLMGVQSDHS